MLKKCLGTIAGQMCSMVGVTDEVILKNSSGQVTKNIGPAKTDGLTGTILDPEILIRKYLEH